MKPQKGDYMDNDENWIHTEVLGQRGKRSSLLSNIIVVIVLLAAGALIVLAFQGKLRKEDLGSLNGAKKIVVEETDKTAETTKEPEEVKYIVQSGDILALVGEKFGVSWQAIAEKNNIPEPYALEVGQELTIPGVYKEEAPATKGDATSADTAPADSTSTSDASYDTYTVQAGDILSTIGAKLNVDWQKIAELNNIPAPYSSLEIGQVLKIPKS